MWTAGTRWRRAGTSALVVLGTAATVTLVRSADHRDGTTVQADEAADINDVYVFQGPTTSSNVVMAMTVSPLIPATEASTTYFSSDVLYQLKIDTNGDAVEDYVVQATFTAPGPNQQFTIRGPAAPGVTGTLDNRVLTTGPTVSGPISTSATPIVRSASGITAFAGVRDDPFFFDLTRFQEIFAGTQTGFRNPGVDTFAAFNTLAIVVEFPRSLLGGASSIGVWATTSKP